MSGSTKGTARPCMHCGHPYHEDRCEGTVASGPCTRGPEGTACEQYEPSDPQPLKLSQRIKDDYAVANFPGLQAERDRLQAEHDAAVRFVEAMEKDKATIIPIFSNACDEWYRFRETVKEARGEL